MRHNVKGRKLGRTTEHRQAMFRNQLSSLVDKGRIRTTLSKAKELRPMAEKMVTKGKVGSVHARRQVRELVADRALVKKLFDDIAPRFQERPGGYTRIVKLGPRPGDGAEMALLEWVDYVLEGAAKPEPEEKKGRGRKKAAAKGGDETPAEEKPKKKAAPKGASKAAPKRAPKRTKKEADAEA